MSSKAYFNGNGISAVRTPVHKTVRERMCVDTLMSIVSIALPLGLVILGILDAVLIDPISISAWPVTVCAFAGLLFLVRVVGEVLVLRRDDRVALHLYVIALQLSSGLLILVSSINYCNIKQVRTSGMSHYHCNVFNSNGGNCSIAFIGCDGVIYLRRDVWLSHLCRAKKTSKRCGTSWANK
jgi:hypothetical protein